MKNVIAQEAHLLVEIHGWVVRKLLLTLRLNYDKYGKHQMTTPTTNRFLTKALRILCCAVALTACSTWATVVNWQLSGSVGTTKDSAQSGYTTTAWGVNNTPATDASNQLLFKTAPASETTAGLTGSLNNRLQASDSDVQQASTSTLSARSSQPESLFAASNTEASSTAPLGGAIAAAFDEEFVSVPTVQFASMAATTTTVALAARAAADVDTDPAPVPEMSALFPIVGLIAAVSCTQILRRRRAAQQSAPRSLA